MSESSKITFADAGEADSDEAFMLQAIKVVAEETRKSFSVGFTQAIEFYRFLTQPQMAQLPNTLRARTSPEMGGGEEEELGPGLLDMSTLNSLSPEGREAVLARYGLTYRSSEPQEPDPTHQVVRETLSQCNTALQTNEEEP